MSDTRVILSQYTKNKVYNFHFIFWFANKHNTQKYKIICLAHYIQQIYNMKKSLQSWRNCYNVFIYYLFIESDFELFDIWKVIYIGLDGTGPQKNFNISVFLIYKFDISEFI